MPTRAEYIHAALAERKSVRAYLDRTVPRDVIARVLESAAKAPSGNNNQPWQVDVVTGDPKVRLSAAIIEHRHTGGPPPEPEYKYFPSVWPEPHRSRRREVGWALYRTIGVERGDRAGAMAHHDRNFQFFNAPVGLILSINRSLGMGAYIDIGLFMQSLAMAAMAEGLSTCMQAAFAPFHEIIRQHLDIDTEQQILCGMSLGYEDTAAPINQLQAPRVPAEEFARFHCD